MGVWIGGVRNGHFPESQKYFSEAEICRKIPEIPQKERFLPNFRLWNSKFRARKNAIPYHTPSHSIPPLDSLLNLAMSSDHAVCSRSTKWARSVRLIRIVQEFPHKTSMGKLWITSSCCRQTGKRDDEEKEEAGVLRGNTIRGNTTRNSERKMALWEGLWEVLWQTSENLWKLLKTSKNLWKRLKPSLSEIFSETLSEADFPLRTSHACYPESCCPLNFLRRRRQQKRERNKRNVKEGGEEEDYTFMVRKREDEGKIVEPLGVKWQKPWLSSTLRRGPPIISVNFCSFPLILRYHWHRN